MGQGTSRPAQQAQPRPAVGESSAMQPPPPRGAAAPPAPAAQARAPTAPAPVAASSPPRGGPPAAWPQTAGSTAGRHGEAPAQTPPAPNGLMAAAAAIAPTGLTQRVSDKYNQHMELFAEKLTSRYVEYVEVLKASSPRILLVGDTGTGKSNLVNVIFGFRPEEDGDAGAEVRAGGRPCTQEFAEYGPSDLVPVRIIDSKGVEKMTVRQQMEDLRSFIAESSASQDNRKHIHIVWYFVCGRFQDADALIIRELQKTCGVLVILNKRDQISNEGAANTIAAVRAEFPDIKIAECGDPRGTMNWIPTVCEDGHDDVSVNLRRKTWHCQHVVRTEIDPSSGQEIEIWCSRNGNDQPFGHKVVVDMSLTLLPEFSRLSFLTAQRVDLQKKHVQAAKVILSATAMACGVGATPIPFSDLPFLFAIEAGMAAELMAVYGVPLKISSSELLTVPVSIVGIGGATGYVAAQALKAVPGLNIVGASVDMLVAGTTVCMLGVALSVVLTKVRLSGASEPEEMTQMISSVASKLSVKSIFGLVSKLRRGGAPGGGDDNGITATRDMIESALADT